MIGRLLFALLLLVSCGGCVLSRAASEYGAVMETTVEPQLIYLGTDGSITVKGIQHYDRKEWAPRVRYFLTTPAAVAKMVQTAEPARHDEGGRPILSFTWRNGEVLPIAVDAPAATAAALPAAVREGRTIPWPTWSRRDKQRNDGFLYELEGKSYWITPYDPRQFGRQYRSPGNEVISKVLLVPAFVVDVVTFPLQVLFVGLGGT